MSTVQKVNFDPCSNLLQTQLRDFSVPMNLQDALLNPFSPLCLIDGEWLTLNGMGEVVRATDVTSAGAVPVAGNGSFFPCFSERGRTDVQAIKKVTTVYAGPWTFDTRIFDASATVANGAAIATVGQPLKVATITMSGRNFSGLVGKGGGSNDTGLIVAYVERLPATNGGKLRIRKP